MGTKTHILEGSKRLTPFVEAINNKVSVAIQKIEKIIPISDVDIVIYDNPKGAIPEVGVGGYAYDDHVIFVFLNPEFPHFDRTINDELERTLAHELHHTLRWRNPGYGKTLLEALITEGLADHFDIEINNKPPHPWDSALTPNQEQILEKRAQAEFQNKNYDHNGWFFGSKEKNIPRWTGYTLGFKLVKKYFKSHPNKKASDLVAIKAEEFIK